MRNPGRMLISVDDFYAGSHSLCRNPIIQKMFMLLGYGEKAGSGADYIVKGWENNQWGRPVIEETVQPDTVLLTLKLGKEEMQKDEITNKHLSQAVPSLSQAVLSLSQACPKLNQYTTDVIAEFIYALRQKPQPILKLMEILGETNRTRFRNKILIPLMENGLIEPTIKEVPNNPKQLYRLCKQL